MMIFLHVKYYKEDKSHWKNYKIGSIINWMDKGLKAEEPQDIVDNLNPTENWEASEEAHGASNQAKLGLSCHLGEWTKKYVG